MRKTLVMALLWLIFMGIIAAAAQSKSSAPVAPSPQSQPVSASQPAAATRPQQLPAFESQFNVALQKAKAEGKVLLLELYRQDCQFCQRMMASVYPQPETLAFSKRFVWLRLDQEDSVGAELRRRYQAGSTPMYLALGHDGVTVYYRFSGAMSRRGFIHNLGLIMVGEVEVRTARQSGGDKPSQAQRLIMAKGELMAGRTESALTMLQKIVTDDPQNTSGLVDDALVMQGMIAIAPTKQTGRQQAYDAWARVIRQYPTADRGPDAVMYIGKMLRDQGRRDLVDRINPLIKDYPEGVDVAACAKVLDQK